jgi:hypothetical protein
MSRWLLQTLSFEIFLTIKKETTKVCRVAILEPDTCTRNYTRTPTQFEIKDLTFYIQQINDVSWFVHHKRYFAEDEVYKISERTHKICIVSGHGGLENINTIRSLMCVPCNVIFNFRPLFSMIPLTVKREGDMWPSEVWSDERFMTYSKQVSLSVHCIATETLDAPNGIFSFKRTTSNGPNSSLERKVETWIFFVCFHIFLVHCLCCCVVRQ